MADLPTPTPTPCAPAQDVKLGDVHVTERVKRRLSGTIICGLIGMAVYALVRVVPLPTMLAAIIAGLCLHRLNSVERLQDGIQWSARNLLYIGVALMGLRIDLADISQTGFAAPLLVISALLATLAVGYGIARLMGKSLTFSILMSGAVAICGVSAAAAICSVLKESDERHKEMAITVASITALSTTALLLYPLLAQGLGLSNLASGILMGGSIHNVSQAVGAGYAVSNEAGDISVLLKLIRVSMLLPIVIGISIFVGRTDVHEGLSGLARLRAYFPTFLVAFFSFAMLSCFNLVPDIITQTGNRFAHIALVVSLIAIGIQTDLKEVLSVGAKPLLAMTLTTGFMAAFLLIGIYLLGIA